VYAKILRNRITAAKAEHEARQQELYCINRRGVTALGTHVALVHVPQKYRTKNWAAYNTALKARGSLLIWLDPTMIGTAGPLASADGMHASVTKRFGSA
jgi:hypothetical protein